MSSPKAMKGIMVPESPSIVVVTSDQVSIVVTPKENQKKHVTLSALPDTGADIDAFPEEVYMDSFSEMKLRKAKKANNGSRYTD